MRICSAPEYDSEVVYTTLQLCRSHYDKTASRRKQRAERYPSRKGYAQNWAYLKKYGVTAEDVASILETQDGRCAICQAVDPGGKGSFHVDHDHSTNRIRGLLCTRCNMGLGYFSDNSLIWRKLRHTYAKDSACL